MPPPSFQYFGDNFLNNTSWDSQDFHAIYLHD